MPIHWGAFSLAPHTWTEPVEQLSKRSEGAGFRLIIPELGRSFVVNEDYPSLQWWKTNATNALADNK